MRDRKLGRDPKRIKPFLKLLKKLWMKHPDMRFYQLIVMLSDVSHGDESDPFNTEDSVTIKDIRMLLK